MGFKHTKVRQRGLNCLHCGAGFVTGSSIQDMCSPECRVASLYAQFAGVDGCWVWPKSHNPQTGYGQINTHKDGKHVLLTAHRISYAATFGPIPDGMSVLHRCDNRPCFNPAHLFVGTQTDNMRDMAKKGRYNPAPPAIPWQHLHPERVPRGASWKPRDMPKGSAHHMAKLCEADVAYIRASTDTTASLGRRFGVTPEAVGNIRRGKTWRHVSTVSALPA